MPRFDATGPLGLGSGTGKGLGPCGAGLVFRRGFGRGLGGRKVYTKKEESQALEQEAGVLEEELKAVKERLGELKRTK